MNPNPVPPFPQQPKKKMSGCVVALLIVAGLFVLMMIIAGIRLAVFMRSDTGRKLFEAADKTVQAAQKGLNAPGTAEVRALGCHQAVVLDMGDVAGIINVFADAGTLKDDGKVSNEMMVMCQGQFGDKLPSCDEVAKAYVGAVGIADRPFLVMVQRQGNSKPLCRARYSMSGENQGPLPEENH